LQNIKLRQSTVLGIRSIPHSIGTSTFTLVIEILP